MRPANIAIISAATLVAGLFGYLIGGGLLAFHVFVMFALFVLAAHLIGTAIRTDEEPWLPVLLSWGMIAKLAGSWARYFTLFEFYGGSGDARRYHSYGVDIAETWRSLQVPDLNTVGFGGDGTRFTAWFTGLTYAPYEPSLFAGFWIFALLAFLGQILIYLAFRKSIETGAWKRYAILIFFWPTLLYWPSSIGKEALILLFLGLAAWAAASLFQRYQVSWLPPIAFSILVVSMVRVHVATLFAAAVLVAVVLEKRKLSYSSIVGRILIILVGVAAFIPLANELGEEFGLDFGSSLDTDDLEPVFSRVSDATMQGGSAVSGGIIDSPADIPAGVAKVLFRPFPFEASNIPMLAASAEGTLLLALIGWRLPEIIRNRKLIRRSPYLLLCVAYSALFIWGWSAIQNLGIINRQRSLVIPFILALVAILGWRSQDDTLTEARTPVSTTAP